MNMGGGMLIRTVGRAAGPTTPTSSASFCSACSGQLPRPSSLRTVCRGCQNGTLSHQVAGTGSHIGLEDWEFADDLGADSKYRPWPQDSRFLTTSFSPATFHHPYRDVFGVPPTFDEAAVAASDLQAAFMETIATNDNLRSRSSCSTPSEQDEIFLQASIVPQEAHSDSWIEPPVSQNLPLNQVVKNPVYEAFQLLQDNPHVKDAVVSLASDPDVWHAMMRNKEMQELRHKFEKFEGNEKADTNATPNDGDDPLGGIFSVLHKVAEISIGIICRVQGDIFRVVMTILSLLSGSNHSSSAKEAHADKAVSSTMMLAMLVVVVVLLKRLPA